MVTKETQTKTAGKTAQNERAMEKIIISELKKTFVEVESSEDVAIRFQKDKLHLVEFACVCVNPSQFEELGENLGIYTLFPSTSGRIRVYVKESNIEKALGRELKRVLSL